MILRIVQNNLQVFSKQTESKHLKVSSRAVGPMPSIHEMLGTML